MALQTTSITFVYWTVYSGAAQGKHQSSASLAFLRRIHRWPMNSPHKWPVKRKMVPFDVVIMTIVILNINSVLIEEFGVSAMIFGCQPDEHLASLMTTNRIISVYCFLGVILFLMYVDLHCLYSIGNIISTTTNDNDIIIVIMIVIIMIIMIIIMIIDTCHPLHH